MTVLLLFRFHDSVNKKVLEGTVCFQILVEPGSYKIGPSSTHNSRPPDLHFSCDNIEWATKERGSTILYALLIKIHGI